MTTTMESGSVESSQKSDLLKEVQSQTTAVPAATSAQGKRSNDTTVHPSPASAPPGDRAVKPTGQGMNMGGLMLDPFQSQLVTAFSFIVLPIVMTIYRVYFSNGGPTSFSWHPLMMLTSIVSVASSVLAQRIDVRDPVRLTLLACASSWSVLAGLYVIWAVKESYGKPHFLSMHAHMGGMTLGGILTYGLAVPFVYNPFTGQVRNKQYQKYLIQLGKGVTGMALMGMMVGMIEIERSWIMLALWMGSIALFAPFLIL